MLLRYGSDSSLTLQFGEGGLLAHCDAPRGEPLADVDGAVEQALAAPLAFPPLAQSAVAGDRVTLALAPGVPRAATLVKHTVAALRAAGVAASDITLVHTLEDVEAGAPDPLSELPPEERRAVHALVHDAESREAMSYLAAAANGKPIYIHRALHDADLMIPIGIVRLPDALGSFGLGAGVFPTFSDAAARATFRSPKSRLDTERQRLHKKAREASWLLGTQFTIQVVPGAGSAVLHVLAGERDAVEREGIRLSQQAWSFEVPERADLVVATVEGDAHRQTWENVARALAAAARVVSDEGDVALCTTLDERLGPALQRLVGADDMDEAADEIMQVRPRDALPAIELIDALRRGRVFLLSRLDSELIEEMGLAPVEADQLSRLASRHASCVVLNNAHLAVPHLAGETASAPAAERRSSR